MRMGFDKGNIRKVRLNPEPCVQNLFPNQPPMWSQTLKPAVKRAVKYSGTGISNVVLAHTQSIRDLVQDFFFLAESLEWELGQQYLRERGNKAFNSDASPLFVINNDGTLSHYAEVSFASLVKVN